MSSQALIDLFDSIHPPEMDGSVTELYSVASVSGHANCYVGKDSGGLACLLISTEGAEGKPQPPIQLESLDAQFELRCHLRKDGETDQLGIFSVVRCRDADRDVSRYFLSICGAMLSLLGDRPNRVEIRQVIDRLAAIFQKVRQPQERPLSGLFGELFVIWRSANPLRTLAAWRISGSARFDFSYGDIRLEVKTARSRNRIHTFSYDQCNPPDGVIAAVASMYIEQCAGGISVQEVIDAIVQIASTEPDLVLKLHQNVAATLGEDIVQSLSQCFDVHLSASSLQFYDLREIPAIRSKLPPGVSDVHFQSNLSETHHLSRTSLIDQDPAFWDILPHIEP